MKGAKQRILKVRKREFMQQQLPELFRNMKLLNIDIKDVNEAWNNF